MAHPTQITLRIRLAWWVHPYLLALFAFAAITRLEVDVDKAADMISRRGLRIAQD